MDEAAENMINLQREDQINRSLHATSEYNRRRSPSYRKAEPSRRKSDSYVFYKQRSERIVIPPGEITRGVVFSDFEVNNSAINNSPKPLQNISNVSRNNQKIREPTRAKSASPSTTNQEKGFVASMCKFYSEIFQKKDKEIEMSVSYSNKSWTHSPFLRRKSPKLRKSHSFRYQKGEENENLIESKNFLEQEENKENSQSIEILRDCDRTPLLNFEMNLSFDEEVNSSRRCFEYSSSERRACSILAKPSSLLETTDITAKSFSLSPKVNRTSDRLELTCEKHERSSPHSDGSQDSGFSDSGEHQHQQHLHEQLHHDEGQAGACREDPSFDQKNERTASNASYDLSPFGVQFNSGGPLASTPVSYTKTTSRQVTMRRRILPQKSVNTDTHKSAKTEAENHAEPGAESLVLARLRRREALYRSLSLSNSANLNHFSPIFPKISSPPCRTRREQERKERRKSLPVQKVEKDVQTDLSRLNSSMCAKSRSLSTEEAKFRDLSIDDVKNTTRNSTKNISSHGEKSRLYSGEIQRTVVAGGKSKTLPHPLRKVEVNPFTRSGVRASMRPDIFHRTASVRSTIAPPARRQTMTALTETSAEETPTRGMTSPLNRTQTSSGHMTTPSSGRVATLRRSSGQMTTPRGSARKQVDRPEQPLITPVLPELHTSAIIEIGDDRIPQQLSREAVRVNARREGEPVLTWMTSLTTCLEPECMTYLHSKPLNFSKESGWYKKASKLVGRYSCVDLPVPELAGLVATYDALAPMFPDIYSEFGLLNLVQVGRKVGHLVNKSRMLLSSILESTPLTNTSNLADLPGIRFDDRVEVGRTEVDQLTGLLNRLASETEQIRTSPHTFFSLRNIVERLEREMKRLVEGMLEPTISTLLNNINNSHSEASVLKGMDWLVEVGGLNSALVSSLLSRLDSVRVLVGAAVCSQSNPVQLLALRALSSVCSTHQTIKDLDECGGVDVICGLIISSPSKQIKVECAGVLAQITSPWIQNDHRLSSLSPWVSGLVNSLVSLVYTTFSKQADARKFSSLRSLRPSGLRRSRPYFSTPAHARRKPHDTETSSSDSNLRTRIRESHQGRDSHHQEVPEQACKEQDRVAQPSEEWEGRLPAGVQSEGWEGWLLVYALLSHLSSLEPESNHVLAAGNRIRVLINPVAHNPGACVHVTDQLVNILFNLSINHIQKLKDEAVLGFLSHLVNRLEVTEVVHQRILLKSILILNKCRVPIRGAESCCLTSSPVCG